MDNQLDKGQTPADFVRIIEKALTKEVARTHELDRINELRPIFNKNFSYPNHKITNEILKTCFALREGGMYYQEIAKEVGLSTMTVHRAMVGKTKVLENFIG